MQCSVVFRVYCRSIVGTFVWRTANSSQLHDYVVMSYHYSHDRFLHRLLAFCTRYSVFACIPVQDLLALVHVRYGIGRKNITFLIAQVMKTPSLCEFGT